MINKWKIMLSVVCVLLASCVRIPLSKTEQSFNPYSGGEVLVFKSDKQMHSDTVYIFMKHISYMGGAAPVSPNFQSLIVRAYIPNYYLNSYSIRAYILSIKANTYVSFSLSVNERCDFHVKSTIDQIEKLSISSLKIGDVFYDDVIIIERTEQQVSNDNDTSLNPVVRMYWSKRHGYLRFEKRDGERYDLVNKYMDEAKCASFR